MSNTIIEDDKGRTLIIIGDNGKLVVGRYPDMEEQYKEYIVETYKGAVKCSEEDIEHLISFLNFEEDDDEFCV